MHARYWQPNAAGRLGVLVADCDHADPITAALTGTAPPPTAVVYNEQNGHSHALYCLTTPVARGGRAHAAPQRYAEAIRQALTAALHADPAYTHDLSRGPLAPGHTLEAVSGRTYTLDELAAALPLLPRSAAVTPHAADSRNSALFHHLREQLRGWTRRTDDLHAHLTAAATEFNASHLTDHPRGPLPLSELRATVGSVYRYGMAHKHTQPRRRPTLPGAVDRSQVYSSDRPPPAPVAVQQARQAAAGQMTAARRREATRAEIRAGVAVLTQQGQPVTAATLVLVTGLARSTINAHRDVWDAEN